MDEEHQLALMRMAYVRHEMLKEYEKFSQSPMAGFFTDTVRAMKERCAAAEIMLTVAQPDFAFWMRERNDKKIKAHAYRAPEGFSVCGRKPFSEAGDIDTEADRCTICVRKMND